MPGRVDKGDLLEESDRLAHGGFYVQRFDVLPVLLRQGDEEVDGKHDIAQDLVIRHLDVAYGDT